MIQRIQTLWLLVAVAAGLLSIKFPFYTGTLVVNNAYLSLTAAENIPILVLTVISVLISFITIFLFKNRKLQTNLTLLNILIQSYDIHKIFLTHKNPETGTRQQQPETFLYFASKYKETSNDG